MNWTAGVQLNLDGTEKVSEVVWGNNTFVCALENPVIESFIATTELIGMTALLGDLQQEMIGKLHIPRTICCSEHKRKHSGIRQRTFLENKSYYR